MGRSLFSNWELEGQDAIDWEELNFAIQDEDEVAALVVIERMNPVITWAYDLEEQQTLAQQALNRELFNAVIAMNERDCWVTAEEAREAREAVDS